MVVKHLLFSLVIINKWLVDVTHIFHRGGSTTKQISSDENQPLKAKWPWTTTPDVCPKMCRWYFHPLVELVLLCGHRDDHVWMIFMSRGFIAVKLKPVVGEMVACQAGMVHPGSGTTVNCLVVNGWWTHIFVRIESRQPVNCCLLVVSHGWLCMIMLVNDGNNHFLILSICQIKIKNQYRLSRLAAIASPITSPHLTNRSVHSSMNRHEPKMNQSFEPITTQKSHCMGRRWSLMLTVKGG